VSGIERIAATFAGVRADGRRAALMPYMMGGFPDGERALEVGRAYARAGADLIELGFPFSDPLADGPVIHDAAVRALRQGAHVHDIIQLGAQLAGELPVVAMCYVNPVLARGPERFVAELEEAGFSGLIVPDLPLEEAELLRGHCDGRALALIPLVAPTTPPARLERIAASARGFVYCVSLTGTTGERDRLAGEQLAGLLSRVHAASEVPVAAGFGISTPQQARAAALAGADGVIVGSRLVRAAAQADDPAGEVERLVGAFAAALG
jgi:tryptophan synthase alpha chain